MDDENNAPVRAGGEVTSASSEAGGMQLSAIEVEWRGPLPPPRVLAGYDQIVPGIAQKMADGLFTQSQHRREMEKAAMNEAAAANKHAAADSKRKQWMGFSAFVLSIALSALALLTGAQWAAGIIIPAFAAVSAVFVFGGRKK